MVTNETFKGLEVRLQPRGWGRFLVAAFLCFWLCGWAAGEVFAIWLISGGVVTLAGGTSGFDSSTISTSGILIIGVFIIGWLALWTVGGISALRELLRLLWGEDRLIAGLDGLLVEHRYGPFVSRKFLPRAELDRIERNDDSALVVAHLRSSSKPVKLTTLASPDEVDVLVGALRQRLGVAVKEPEPNEGKLAEGWIEQRSEDGVAVLTKDPRRRQHQAWVVAALGLGLLAATCGWFIQFPNTPANLVFGSILSLLAGLCGWGAHRLHTVQEEWTLEPNPMQRRWRTPTGVRVRSSGQLLVVVRERDSDGDSWFRLELWSPEATTLTRKGRATLLSVMRDRSEPLRMGHWIARKTGIAFEDRTTATAERVHLAQLKEQLAASGRFGRWCARKMPDQPR